MKVEYIAQPNTQLGKVLADLLDSNPPPTRIVFVSAFVSVQTLMRVKQQIFDLKEAGANVRFVSAYLTPPLRVADEYVSVQFHGSRASYSSRVLA